ncbi:LysR family transcriptional regulator [Kitasatospora sp. CM 4170]|uniref:LysR family transcriptional regulator n=1 Tax=Kitasatospora aburaviensis TaxID=67265 RepID=A0ABW1F702_9ACTN|nr:LysR family transcriptional regulator [Kitasatospora sp. CM 4170]WNM46984.1 LysR family transcriptional regulator [Kitasatospora sp. CM 4170]
MELRQLRYFCAVAEEENLGRAAQRLGLRSPSLSQQIRSLEAEFGVPLFARSPAGMTLTAAGAALLPEARATLAAAERGMRAVAAAASAARVWTVGVPPGVPPELPRRFRTVAREAGVALVFEDAGSAEQLVRLRRRELDCCVLTLPVDADGLESVVIHDEPLGVLLCPKHPLAACDAVDWADLEGQELLWFRRELAPGYHDAVLAACHAAGWRPAVRAVAPRRALLLAELISGDQVVALRPRPVVAEPGLTWRPLAQDPPRLRLALAWTSDVAHSGLRAIARMLAC